MSTVIVGHSDLPDAAFELMRVAFPDDKVDQRAFWDAHPDSVHALVYDGDGLVAHAGYVTRTLYVADRAITAAYVEYVAAEPRRRGFGSGAMQALQAEIVRRGFSLAALATGSPAFYERLGWRPWRGAAAYRAPDGTVVPTPDEKPMVLDLGANVNLDAAIACDWREVGDIGSPPLCHSERSEESGFAGAEAVVTISSVLPAARQDPSLPLRVTNRRAEARPAGKARGRPEGLPYVSANAARVRRRRGG